MQPNRELMAARLNAGLSIPMLAVRAGLSANTVRMAERGFTPQVHSQFAIASALQMRVLDLWPIERQRMAA